MNTSSRKQTPNSKVRTTPPGTGELHQALEAERDRAELARFCSAHVCTRPEVSDDGQRLHLPHVLQLMRSRGYDVSQPTRPQHQPKKGLTAWIVHIRTSKVEFDMAFYTPDAPKPGVRTKSPKPYMEPA